MLPTASLYTGSKKLGPEARLLVARMTTTPPNSRRRRAIDRFIKRLKLSGAWARLDWLIVPQAHDWQSALFDWTGSNDYAGDPNGYDALANGSAFANWTVNVGIRGVDATQPGSFLMVGSGTAGAGYRGGGPSKNRQDDSTFGCWINELVLPAGAAAGAVGDFMGNQWNQMHSYGAGGYWRVDSGNNQQVAAYHNVGGATAAEAVGLQASRRDTDNGEAFFRNLGKYEPGSYYHGLFGVGASNEFWTLTCTKTATAFNVANGSPSQFSMFFAGAGMTDAQVASIYYAMIDWQAECAADAGFGGDLISPTITSNNIISVSENVQLDIALTASETVTWTIDHGADAARFSILGSTLTLPAKDFELPSDSDLNNVYQVSVRATDTAGNFTLQDIFVTVTDAADAGSAAGTMDFRLPSQSGLIALI